MRAIISASNHAHTRTDSATGPPRARRPAIQRAVRLYRPSQFAPCASVFLMSSNDAGFYPDKPFLRDRIGRATHQKVGGTDGEI
jgi:hypothetical protein